MSAVAPARLRRVSVRDRPRARTGRQRGHAGLVSLALVTLVALTAPLLAPHDPLGVSGAGFLHAPSSIAWLGTDEQGRDIFSRVLYGIRTSWFSALAVVGFAAVFGGLIGLVAGAAGGFLDGLLMRITDLFLALPGTVLAIAVVGTLGPSLTHSLLALAIVWWPWYARVARGEVRALASRPAADAAWLAGVTRRRLLLRHLLPGTAVPMVVTMSLDVGNLILALGALSFIGLGAPPPSPELGAMSAQGLDSLIGHAWVPIAPALALALLAFISNLAGDGIARRLDHGQRTTR